MDLICVSYPEEEWLNKGMSKDLNKAILRENYPMPTIDDIATRLHGAKVFSAQDAKNGF